MRDSAKAQGLYEKACDLGEGGGCYHLGDLAAAGKGELIVVG